jgi:1-deoxy-D-xylulose-5-phosphate synthase
MDEHELRHLMYTAQLPDKGPFVIRYPRGRGSQPDWECEMHEISVGRGRCLKQGTDIALLTLGPIGVTATEAVKEAERERPGLSIAHYEMRFLRPLDNRLLTEIAAKFRRVVTVEDGVRRGGFGTAVLEWMADHGAPCRVTRLGLPDEFVEHGSPAELYRLCGLDCEGIKRALLT